MHKSQARFHGKIRADAAGASSSLGMLSDEQREGLFSACEGIMERGQTAEAAMSAAAGSRSWSAAVEVRIGASLARVLLVRVGRMYMIQPCADGAAALAKTEAKAVAAVGDASGIFSFLEWKRLLWVGLLFALGARERDRDHSHCSLMLPSPFTFTAHRQTEHDGAQAKTGT